MNVTPEIQARVLHKIREVLAKGRSAYEKYHGRGAPSIMFTMPKVSFDVRGLRAGVASYYHWELMFNPIILMENVEDFLERTVGHEVAHLVSFTIDRELGRGHGPLWKRVMSEIGQEPTRCHSYDTTSTLIASHGAAYIFTCGCPELEHTLSKRIYNSVMRDGDVRTCRKCRKAIKFLRKTT